MEFSVLGPLEVRAADAVVQCTGAKQRLLLAVLLLHANEVVSCDRLIEALWGERPPATATKALQMHVLQLRKLLEPDRGRGKVGQVLVTKPPGYMLVVKEGQLDLDAFKQQLSRGRVAHMAGDARTAAAAFAEALVLWRGPPLADLAFEPALQPDIAALEELWLAAMESRIDADLDVGRHAELIGGLERLAALHPLRERLRGQLMVALYRAGRQAEALAVYQDARRVLVDELGIEPSRALKELERRILVQDPELEHPGHPRVAAVARGPIAVEGFVGRDSELAVLRPEVEAALSGDGAIILIGGEPGIGKSRLADSLAVQARDGSRVIVGRCWEAGGAPPYWPWVQALRAYVSEGDRQTLQTHMGRGAAELAVILPEISDLVTDVGASQALGAEGARFRLFESVAAFLTNAARSEPLAIFLDDLHAADAPSLLLLRFVAGQMGHAPMLIVGCYRDTEVGPDLEEALAELSREPSVHRLTLEGLGSSDLSRLLERTLGQTPAEDLVARVHAETEGNPLFAAEIGRLLASERTGGHNDGALPVPAGVREAIRRRLRRHSVECRELLALASVIGREFELNAIARVSRLADGDLFRVLEEAAAARLIGDVPGARGRLRFSHILVRDALYEDLSAPRRLQLHRAIGDALEELYADNPDPHLAELAHHYLEAGTAAAAKAIRYSRRCGDQAAGQHAHEEAARHYATALRVLNTSGSGDANSVRELLLALGESQSRAGREPEAKKTLQRAATLAERAGRPDQLARAALEYGGRFAWTRASTDPGLVPLLERALARADGEDDHTRVRLLVRLAGAIRDDPSRERRVRLAEEALDTARRTGDPVTFAYALEGHYVAVEGPELLAQGDGITVGAKLISLGEQIGDKERVFAGHDHRLHGFWMLGDRAGVEVELEALASLAGELRQTAQRWHVGTGLTMLALMEGRFAEAEQLVDETLALGRRAQSWNAVVTYRLALFVLRRAEGRLAELADTIARSVHEYPALLRFRCALAHLHSELGRDSDARTALDAVLSADLSREYVDAEWLFSMCLLADPCAFLGDQDAAAQLHSLLQPYERLYAQAPVEAVFGSVARALGVLATTLRRYQQAERHLHFALEMERRMGARPWFAQAQHDLAAMLLARGGPGDGERARSLLDEASATYHELHMETWRARAMALAGESGR